MRFERRTQNPVQLAYISFAPRAKAAIGPSFENERLRERKPRDFFKVGFQREVLSRCTRIGDPAAKWVLLRSRAWRDSGQAIEILSDRITATRVQRQKFLWAGFQLSCDSSAERRECRQNGWERNRRRRHRRAHAGHS